MDLRHFPSFVEHAGEIRHFKFSHWDQELCDWRKPWKTTRIFQIIEQNSRIQQQEDTTRYYICQIELKLFDERGRRRDMFCIDIWIELIPGCSSRTAEWNHAHYSIFESIRIKRKIHANKIHIYKSSWRTNVFNKHRREDTTYYSNGI